MHLKEGIVPYSSPMPLDRATQMIEFAAFASRDVQILRPFHLQHKSQSLDRIYCGWFHRGSLKDFPYSIGS